MTLSILTSVVVRTFAWIVILGRQGVLNKLLMGIGLIDHPLPLLFTEARVILVLAQVQLPLMVLPIVTVMGRADSNLETHPVPLVPANGARSGASRCCCPYPASSRAAP